MVKVPTTTYDQQQYVNLFKVAAELNKPHLDRIKLVFDWCDNQSINCPLATILTPLVKIKAPPEDPAKELNHIKKLYLTAYNEYYDVVYLPEDVNLDD